MSRNNKKSFFTRLFENNISLAVISLFFAVIVWAVVSSTQTTSTERTISGVPFRVELGEELAEEGYIISGSQSFAVDVTVEGPSYVVNGSKFTENNITVTADVTCITGPGEYKLPITATVSDNDVTVIGTSETSVSVTIDVISEKTFPITLEYTKADGYSVAAGTITGEPVLSADEITLKGPSEILELITGVKAVAELDGEIKDDSVFPVELVYVTADDGKTDLSAITSDIGNDLHLKVPVSHSGTYTSKVKFTGAPADLEESGIAYTITPASVEVTIESADDTALVSEDGTITVGTIDFATVNNEVNYKKITCTIGGEEITFTVKIDMSDLYKRWIELPVDVSDEKLPSNVTVNSKSVKSVQVISPDKAIMNLSTTEGYAVPNLEGLDLSTPGTYVVPAIIKFRTLTNAWAYGPYYVEVTVS